MEITIRELKAKDLKTVAKMLGKLRGQARLDILNLLKNGGVKTREEMLEAGFSIIQTVGSELADDLMAWFADLAGLTPEQFDEAPISAPIQVVRQLARTEGIRDFFDRASTSASPPGN